MSKKIKTVLSLSITLILSLSFLVMPVSAITVDEQTTAANIEFTPGSLLFDSIPAFDFGSHVISAVDTTYAGTVTGKMSVADARGDNAGWNLEVSLNAFSNDGGTTKTLLGSKIKITPSASYTTAGSGKLPSTVAPFVELISGDTTFKNITIAAVGEGTGLMENVITASEITVYSGDSVLPGGHSAVIDWVLGNTP